ncbi:hypothetical protein FB451DRAFT_1562430 [Mycena latifolia]|nr:hypothetical protein FB451DRAFT_1562430 [Mycena latifolia]
MEESSQVLDVQELVDQCIEFLNDSVPDLKACALVSRSWTSAAQNYIFREVSIKSRSSEGLWARLQQTLLIFPHLIRHIHRLHLHSHGLSPGAFVAICKLRFTHLRYAAVFHGKPVSLRVGMAIKNVFQSFPADSAEILEKHFRRESFRDWLMHDLCPLDISHLKNVSTACRHEDVLQRPTFAPALLCPGPHTNVFDLSTLPNLALIRMSVGTSEGWHIALEILSTLPAASRVRKITINTSFLITGYRCAQLDSKLLSLPIHARPVLELEGVPHGPSREYLKKSFSRMTSLKLLRHVPRDEHWFENFVDAQDRSRGGNAGPMFS